MESMGLLSGAAASTNELTDLELDDFNETNDSRKPAWRRLWLARKDSKYRFAGLPISWIVGCSICAAIALLMVAALLYLLPRKTLERPVTGVYPNDAPFREVIRDNFPDPTLFWRDGIWYAWASNDAAGIIDSRVHGKMPNFGQTNIQLATSTDFLHWTIDRSASVLPRLGDWVTKQSMPALADPSVQVPRANVWAPEILHRTDDRFVVYYAATALGQSHLHCLGAAVSNTTEGPFEPLSEATACPLDLGGAIDAGAIIDSDGSTYVAYKIDGNALGNGGECLNTVGDRKNTPIYLQKMEADGITSSGDAIVILDRTDDDGPLVEAPSIVRSDEGIYFLFYSAGCTFDPSYNVKYATSNNIAGPYTRAKSPLLETGSWGLFAPGSVSVQRDRTHWKMAFHARLYTDVGGIRAMYVANVTLEGVTASLQAPD